MHAIFRPQSRWRMVSPLQLHEIQIPVNHWAEIQANLASCRYPSKTHMSRAAVSAAHEDSSFPLLGLFVGFEFFAIGGLDLAGVR